MTNDDLTKTNNERKRKGLPTLTRAQAEAALRRVPPSRREDDGFDTVGFLVGYLTGIPVSPSRGFSTEAVVGSLLHNTATPSVSEDKSPTSSQEASHDTSPTTDTSPSSSDPGGSSGGGGFDP